MKFHLDFPNKKVSGKGIAETHIVSDWKSWKKTNDFIKNNKGKFIFCLLSYDLKTIFHDIESTNIKNADFPLALFVVPEEIDSTQIDNENYQNEVSNKIEFPSEIEYLKALKHIKSHLKRGDIYETNFCIAPKAKVKIDPIKTYQNIIENNKAPFNGYVEYEDQFLLCSSPERFIQKRNNSVISQPIKGTIKRGASIDEDNQLKNQLLSDPKETAENIMIVDLVRNDLSQIAKRNSVKVDKLNEVQSFKTVHQLVSTISCQLKEDVEFEEIIEATFPMGSMTGAPKKKAMELMEQYEDFKRGIYSGSIGYIDENGDFDLNVIIRSVIYDGKKELVSMPVGSAITYKSIAEKEYQECVLKAKSMIQSLAYVD